MCLCCKRRCNAHDNTRRFILWYARASGIESKQGNGGGTFAHIDIAIDFYAWVFPKRRYELIKLISGKAAFLESIQKELEELKK